MEANAFIVNELLDGKSNYEKWSIQVKTYLWGRDLWEAVDPEFSDDDNEEEEEEEEGKNSDDQLSERKNAVALHAILISCETEPFQVIKNISSAREAWAALQAEYGQKPTGDEEREIESESDRTDQVIERLKSIKSFKRNESNKIRPPPPPPQPSGAGAPMPAVESESEEESGSESESDEIQTEPDKSKIPPPAAKDQQKPTESESVDIRPYWTMFQAVKVGDWETARLFLDQHPEAIRATIPYSGKNALHVAVSEGHLHIVENLVAKMTDQEIEMRRVDSFTPLAAAIEIGNLAIAQCLIRRHRKLVTITHPEGLPVRHAIVSCRRKMVPYLYSVTPIEELKSLDNGIHCAALLSQCIYAKHYDIALNLLVRVPELAITVDDPGKSPLWALATSKLFSDNESSLVFWQRWIYECIHISSWSMNHISVEIENIEDMQSDREDSSLDKALDSFCVAGKLCSGMLRRMASIPLRFLDINSIYQMKLIREQTREILRRVCLVIEGTSDRAKLQSAGLSSAMIQAAYHGNVDFITGIAKANPELVWGPYISRKVIEVAIQLRQPKIFSLVYGLRDKVALASYRDENRSNMLHKAAIIAPGRLLNRIPGAALQMQRELQWFKEVENIVSPAATIATTAAHPGSTTKKKEYLTPHDIFTESHKDLVTAGEKWMKDTSSSCTVVGALIITVTFAAAFTFPGGNEQSHGYPMFMEKMLFRVFTISNAVALSASTTSVLMFLGILTSRYAEEDFLTSLPKKLIIGLSTLFFSIAAMLTAFCAGLSVMFHHALWIVIPSALLAGIPVALFAAIQFPLLVDIFMSTYGPSIFYKNTQRWV